MPSAEVILAILVRPWLWASAWRFKPTKGFLPPKEYVEFRMETMYGDKNHRPSAAEMVTFLNWCRSFHRASRQSRREAQKRLEAVLAGHDGCRAAGTCIAPRPIAHLSDRTAPIDGSGATDA